MSPPPEPEPIICSLVELSNVKVPVLLKLTFSRAHHCPASRVDAAEDGDHRLCFDNSHSKLSQKMIFFVVTVTGESVAAEPADTWADAALKDQGEMEQPVAAIRVRKRREGAGQR